MGYIWVVYHALTFHDCNQAEYSLPIDHKRLSKDFKPASVFGPNRCFVNNISTINAVSMRKTIFEKDKDIFTKSF